MKTLQSLRKSNMMNTKYTSYIFYLESVIIQNYPIYFSKIMGNFINT
jgi:hypothetical protein